jgi:integrase
MTRDQIRGWIVYTREATSSGSAVLVRRHPALHPLARSRGRARRRPVRRHPDAAAKPAVDAGAGARTDPRADRTCTGRDFMARRDAAMIYTFADTGMRLAEVTGLAVDDVDLRTRTIIATGKGSNRSGPRRRIAAARREGRAGARPVPAGAAEASVRRAASAVAGRPQPSRPQRRRHRADAEEPRGRGRHHADPARLPALVGEPVPRGRRQRG